LDLYLKINHNYAEKMLIIYRLILRYFTGFIRDKDANEKWYMSENRRTANAYEKYLYENNMILRESA
jgi:hypothetical protein